MVKHASDRVVVGKVAGVYGLRGWVKVLSYTEPKQNILSYSPWLLRLARGWCGMDVAEGRVHGKGIVARLAACEDRDAAALLVGADIAVLRGTLPKTEAGTYYWTDLIGLRVVTLQGVELGTVQRLFETGANDVLVVVAPDARGGKPRERLIPFIEGDVVREVDLEDEVLRVEWDPEF